MTESWRILRLALADMWENSILVIISGLLGGLISVLLIPLPFVMAGHYGTAARASEGRVATWRTWLVDARSETAFFFKWVFLLLLSVTVFVSNVYFYGRATFWGAEFLRWLMLSLLVLWLLPQPLVPALFLRQSERRLRTALRNAVVLVLQNPWNALLIWAMALLLGLLVAYIAWPLLGVLLPFLAIAGTRVVQGRLDAGHL